MKQQWYGLNNYTGYITFKKYIFCSKQSPYTKLFTRMYLRDVDFVDKTEVTKYCSSPPQLSLEQSRG